MKTICNQCRKPLIIGENWTESKKKRYEYICTNCYNKTERAIYKFLKEHPELKRSDLKRVRP